MQIRGAAGLLCAVAAAAVSLEMIHAALQVDALEGNNGMESRSEH